MARVYGITKKLETYNIDKEVIKNIIGNGDLVDIITKMENMLDHEVTYKVLDSCACGISIKEINSLKKIAADSLEEKIKGISLLADFHASWNISINQDKTLSAGWVLKDGESFACACTAVVHNKIKVGDLVRGSRKMPLTYCYCCAGHCRRHLQKLLDVQLKTKAIVSSPINSGGQKPCAFIFEIIS